jgi:hypothetical protein
MVTLEALLGIVSEAVLCVASMLNGICPPGSEEAFVAAFSGEPKKRKPPKRPSIKV